VIDGDSAPPPQRGTAPNFQPMSCGQTAGWIKMPLGTEVGLSPGHIVLDGEPALPPKGHSPPVFDPYLLWPNGRPSQLLLSTCFKIQLTSLVCVTAIKLLLVHLHSLCEQPNGYVSKLAASPLRLPQCVDCIILCWNYAALNCH